MSATGARQIIAGKAGELRGEASEDEEWDPLQMKWASLPEDSRQSDTAVVLRLANMINAFRCCFRPGRGGTLGSQRPSFLCTLL